MQNAHGLMEGAINVNCCTGPATVGPGHCAVCGERGQPVPRETLEHLLKPEKKGEILDVDYYFCQTPECDIVYFTDIPLYYFDKDDLSVRVGVRESEDPIPVCYCFDFTGRDIVEDMERHGEGRIYKEMPRLARKTERPIAHLASRPAPVLLPEP